MVETVVMFTN